MQTADNLTYLPLNWPAERAALGAFLSSESWPFHGQPRTEAEALEQRLQSLNLHDGDVQYFWIRSGDHTVGLIKLFDLKDIGDGYPLFDLRLRQAWRGRGIGLQAVRWLTRYLFETWPVLDRIEGTTRDDNVAMRKLFLRCGYVKEGHYRKAWDGQHAAIQYAILREDWETGQVTPVPWDDQAGF